MAWHQTGAKPLPESMIALIIDNIYAAFVFNKKICFKSHTLEICGVLINEDIKGGHYTIDFLLICGNYVK